MSSVLTYGSGECEQLGLEGVYHEIKKPRLIPQFQLPLKVKEIVCGGMHTVLLTTHGRVYTWGCNDEGALGREGEEGIPAIVGKGLDEMMTGITCGDSHSIAYNTSLNLVYFWGMYRNTVSGPIGEKEKLPVRIGEKELQGLKVKKVVSGAHHTLLLASGRVFSWGDPESGKIGRKLTPRRKNQTGLLMEPVGLKKVKDIFTTREASFATSEDNKKVKNLYSWGNNGYGQLGHGNIFETNAPKIVKAFKGKEIANVVGGSNHTLVLTKEGDVYSFGLNDDGHLGIGDTYSEYRKDRNEEVANLMGEQAKINTEIEAKNKELRDNTDKSKEKDLKREIAALKRRLKSVERKIESEGDLEGIKYISTPQKIEGLSNIIGLAAGTNYSYAWRKRQAEKVEEVEETKEEPKEETKEDQTQQEPQEENKEKEGKDESGVTGEKVEENADKENGKDSKEEKIVEKEKEEKKVVDPRINQVYSWGMAEHYVLWDKKEDSVYAPYEVDPEMYKQLNPIGISCGTMHVVVRAINVDEKEEDFELISNTKKSYKDIASESESSLSNSRKRKFNEISKDLPSEGADEKKMDPIEEKKEEEEEDKKSEPKPESPKKEESQKEEEGEKKSEKADDTGHVTKKPKLEETPDEEVELKKENKE